MNQTICPLIFASKNIVTAFRNRDSPGKVITYGIFSSEPLTFLSAFFSVDYVCLSTHMHSRAHTRTCTHSGVLEERNFTQITPHVLLLFSLDSGAARQARVEGFRDGPWVWTPHLTVCTWPNHLAIQSLRSPYVKGVCNIYSVGCCGHSENYCKMLDIVGAGGIVSSTLI